MSSHDEAAPAEVQQRSSLAELQDLIQEKYGLESDVIDPDKPMQELGLDSLAIAEYLFEVEDHFAIRLTDDDPEIDTLRKLSVLVDKTITAKEAAPGAVEPSSPTVAQEAAPTAVD